MLKGTFIVMVTPILENDDVDIETLKKNIDWYIEEGLPGICACGGTGEFTSLTQDERLLIAETAVSHSNRRIKCIIGTAAETTKETILYTKHAEEIVHGMLAAGLIGVFISEGATFSAEVAGCQVECGAESGMAAAGLIQMFHGTVEQCVDAASIALQNVTGLACDPVANRVEVPCLGKNIMGGSNAIVSANMALVGFDKVIPLDETIAAIYDIGLKLPLELRCTFGGLGKTNTSIEISKRLL